MWEGKDTPKMFWHAYWFRQREPLKLEAMKTFTTTLALVLTATVMMAFPRGSNLTIEVMGHRPNTLIVVNGQKYNALNNVVQLNGLQPGEYPVKVLRPTYWGDQGVVFRGKIRVPHRSDVSAVISRRGMRVKAFPMAHQGGSYWDQDDHYGGHGQGNGYGNGCPNGCSGACSHGYGSHHTPNTNGNGGFVSTLPHHEPVIEPVVCPPVYIGMSPDAFASALRSIDLATFDSDQIRVAKQIIRRNGASSSQIADIMKALSFESSRLEVAKFGFQFVADPENYFVVNDVFWFSSSIRELDRYINQY